MSTRESERDGRSAGEADARPRDRGAFARVFARAPWALVAVIGLVAAVTVSAGLTLPPTSGYAYQRQVTPAGFNDGLLYKEITARVRAGEGYYAAAVSSQRLHHYPLRPAVAVREPAEAWMLAVLGDLGGKAALFCLVVFTTDAVRRGLASVGFGVAARLYGMAAVGLALIYVPTANGPYLHEIWAGLLITAAIAVWRPGRYGASVALALAACLFREIAAPVLLGMAFCAAADRRWRELCAWAGALAAFAVLAAAHLWLVGRQILPGDLQSPGWAQVGGWPFILANAEHNPLLMLLPVPALSIVTALALLGLARAEEPWARRLAAVTFAFVGLFWFIGRPDNDYWGRLYASLLALGLLWAPRALRELTRPGLPFTPRARRSEPVAETGGA